MGCGGAAGDGDAAERAAALLSRAHAMTDVTGFGLAGHAQNIARASDVGLEIDLESIPLFDGAEILAGAGIRSTIYDDNRANCSGIVTDGSARSELLFDPQTSGGLLAAVPEASFAALEQEFRKAGLPLWRIGHCIAGPGLVRLV